MVSLLSQITGLMQAVLGPGWPIFIACGVVVWATWSFVAQLLGFDEDRSFRRSGFRSRRNYSAYMQRRGFVRLTGGSWVPRDVSSWSVADRARWVNNRFGGGGW